MGNTGRPIKLFLNNVPRGCKRLPNENKEIHRYEISDSENNKLLNNIMKDQPITSSGSPSMNSKLTSRDSG